MSKLKLQYILLILLISSLLSNCDSNVESKSHTELIRIKIGSNERDQKKDILNILQDLSFIPLETNSESLIRRIAKVENVEDRLYIHDQMNDAILVFDIDGTFLHKIGSIGAGPGEFIDLQDFCIDRSSNEVLILSTGKRQVLRYSLDGIHLETSNLPFQSWSINQMGTNYYAHNVGYFDDQNTNLKIMGSNHENIVNSLFEFPSSLHAIGLLALTGNITSNNEGLLYSDQTSSYIHQVTLNGKHYPKYFIDFGDSFWPEEERYEFEAFFRKAQNRELNFLSNSYEEIEDKLVFGYTIKSTINGKPTPLLNAFYNRSTKQLFDHTNIINNMSYVLLSPPVGVMENSYFISILYSESYDYFLDKYENDPLWEELFSSNPIGSNPIVCLFKF
ncbi:MAG: 6-bladed beta-propeller [Fulvivirga sp.]|uniref:6-bladed beta-propeller n=1 Tax=Fulvivirga sp. TaxID=1931237 RepID=UPI0032EEB0AE